eukprot:3214193-Rhodomonas_salina.1
MLAVGPTGQQRSRASELLHPGALFRPARGSDIAHVEDVWATPLAIITTHGTPALFKHPVLIKVLDVKWAWMKCGFLVMQSLYALQVAPVIADLDVDVIMMMQSVVLLTVLLITCAADHLLLVTWHIMMTTWRADHVVC